MKHFYQNVPGWFFHEELFANLIAELADKSTVVEVGSWKGKSAAFIGVELANQNKGHTLTCVDTWKGSDEAAHHDDEDVRSGRLYERFQENVNPLTAAHPDILHTVVMPSLQAAGRFEDETVDLLYLDAAHDYENVRADINAWWSKLKPGAFMVGDDYSWQGVRQAVEEAFHDFGVFGKYPAWVARKG